jgi:hypothetical protein
MLERRIIKEFFEDSQFTRLLSELRYEMKFGNMEEWIPSKWGFSEEIDMEKSSLSDISKLKRSEFYFVVNVTGEEDTVFSFFLVKKEYADMFTWILNSIDPQWWSPIADFDPSDYDEYNQKDEYMH